jgi:KDO2-lipid IV(A) lauroyltransferase
MKFARHLLEYLAARAVLTFLRLLPRSLATGVAMAGSRFLFVCLPRLRRIGLRNLELAFPQFSLAERRQVLEQSFESFGRIIADFAHFPYTTPADLAAGIETSFPQKAEARYRAAKATGRGVIFVTPHLGNWEMLATCCLRIFRLSPTWLGPWTILCSIATLARPQPLWQPSH